MNDLHKNFSSMRIETLDVSIPRIALSCMKTVAHITSTDRLCIAGGFARGLFMLEALGASPQMNDIDIFIDLSADDFARVRSDLEHTFGKAVRFHIGFFEDEQHPRGLIEFNIPQDISEQCAHVKSLQINFGQGHPWANPHYYLHDANIGINQAVINRRGEFLASSLFLHDMKNKTMTMNPQIDWTHRNWENTVTSALRMQNERDEFKEWSTLEVSKPQAVPSGSFWSAPEKQQNTLSKKSPK